METENSLHMVGGAGKSSYATNSKLQEKVIQTIKPIFEEIVGEVIKNLIPEKMVVVDLGCSSGRNTLLVLSEVIETVDNRCRHLEREPPEMMFFLNDLPGNDFNNLFRLLSSFRKNLSENVASTFPYCVAGLPGSFYGKLLPSQYVHLFHSTFSLHWISQVPRGLATESRNFPPNKGNIYISTTSPPHVAKLYQQQFQRDFLLFLESRCDELVPGGLMFLAIVARTKKDVLTGEFSCGLKLLADALNDMVLEGLVEEEKLDSFNMPNYAPSMEEAEAIINAQNRFEILRVEMFESNWDPFDDSNDDIVHDVHQSGTNISIWIRAAVEPLIATHFGESILDELFLRYANNIANHLVKEKTKFPILVLALKKKVLSL